MKMRFARRFAIAAIAAAFAFPAVRAGDDEKKDGDKPAEKKEEKKEEPKHNPDGDERAEKLVNELLKALQIENADEREKAVIQLVHPTLLGPDGKLKRDVKEFSYKKASAAAKFYSVPVVITRVEKGKPIEIPWKISGSKIVEQKKGSRDKYFVQKKDGVAGMPAPIVVFMAVDKETPPLIIDMGSL